MTAKVSDKSVHGYRKSVADAVLSETARCSMSAVSVGVRLWGGGFLFPDSFPDRKAEEAVRTEK